MNVPILSLILLFPLAGLVGLLAIPEDKLATIRRVTCAAIVLPFILSAYVFILYNHAAGGFQFIENIPWVAALGISYHLGVDGINSLLLLLVGLSSLSAFLISDTVVHRQKEYYIFLLLTVIGAYGAFLSLDIFFFYFFHEISVVPVFLMIAIWGTGRKEHAAMKLTLYLTAAAGLSLIGLIALYHATGLNTFDLVQIQQYLLQHPIPLILQNWIFLLIVLGFGITLTLWPFYTWAPEGYAEAPTAISMLHAGVLKKMGAYAIIRFAIQLMPQAAHTWMPIIAVLGVLNIIYCGLVALTQRDLKYVLAYSSCSHMGYILLGLACLNTIGLNGVVFLMFAHGIMASLIFALSGFVENKTKTRNINELGGLSKGMPWIGTLFMMAALASAGIPGFANFVSEIMVLLGSWGPYRPLSILAVLGIVITSIYIMKLIRLGFHGPVKYRIAHFADIKSVREKIPFVLLLAVLLVVGCFPSLILNHIDSSTHNIITSVIASEAKQSF